MTKGAGIGFILISMLGLACIPVRREQSSILRYEHNFDIVNNMFWAPSGHTFDNNLAEFSDENVKIEDHALNLYLEKSEKGQRPFKAAEIRTRRTFKYGKFVARLMAAKGSGVISAFFLYDAWGKKNQEIDIEFTGKNPSSITLNNWIDGKSNSKSIDLPFDATESFHEYAITWKKNLIIWEADGKELYRTRENVPTQQMSLIANIWASKSNEWAGQLNQEILPQKMKIDYIKIYSLK